MSAYDVSAREHLVLSSTKDYIEEVVEYSETILEIHNDIMDNKIKLKEEIDLLRTELRELQRFIEEKVNE
jgi:hypothetical protein